MENCELKLPVDIKLKTKPDFKLQGKFPFSELSVEKRHSTKDFRLIRIFVDVGSAQQIHKKPDASAVRYSIPEERAVWGTPSEEVG
jgi:hypothetical protein